MARELDLLVVGGGPAGAAAAIHGARAGLRVLLFERRADYGRQPGETLHPGIEAIFDRLGVGNAVRAAGFHRHAGIWVRWDGPRRFEPYGADEAGPWLGFQADRGRLDRILIEQAAASGALVRRGASAQAPLASGGRLNGLVADGEPLSARWVIDSTGRGCWLGKALGLPVERTSPPIFATFGWDEEDGGDGAPELEATEGGWRWHAPVGGGRGAWVDAVVDPVSGRRGRGADLGWRMRRCAGPGFFIAGDAAVTFDPSSSRGVLRALMTGMMCAELAIDEARGRIDGDEAAWRYRHWLRSWHDSEADALAALYLRHPCDHVVRAFRRQRRSAAADAAAAAPPSARLRDAAGVA